VTKVSPFFMYPEILSPTWIDSNCSLETVLGRSEFETRISKRGYKYNPFLLYLNSMVSSAGSSLMVLLKLVLSHVHPYVIATNIKKMKMFLKVIGSSFIHQLPSVSFYITFQLF